MHVWPPDRLHAGLGDLALYAPNLPKFEIWASTAQISNCLGASHSAETGFIEHVSGLLAGLIPARRPSRRDGASDVVQIKNFKIFELTRRITAPRLT